MEHDWDETEREVRAKFANNIWFAGDPEAEWQEIRSLLEQGYDWPEAQMKKLRYGMRVGRSIHGWYVRGDSGLFDGGAIRYKPNWDVPDKGLAECIAYVKKACANTNYKAWADKDELAKDGLLDRAIRDLHRTCNSVPSN
jgi:hypothetical protein